MKSKKMVDDSSLEKEYSQKRYAQMRVGCAGVPLHSKQGHLEASSFNIQEVVEQGNQRKKKVEEMIKAHERNLRKETENRRTGKSKDKGPIITNKEVTNPNTFMWKTSYND